MAAVYAVGCVRVAPSVQALVKRIVAKVIDLCAKLVKIEPGPLLLLEGSHVPAFTNGHPGYWCKSRPFQAS